MIQLNGQDYLTLCEVEVYDGAGEFYDEQSYHYSSEISQALPALADQQSFDVSRRHVMTSLVEFFDMVLPSIFRVMFP